MSIFCSNSEDSFRLPINQFSCFGCHFKFRVPRIGGSHCRWPNCHARAIPIPSFFEIDREQPLLSRFIVSPRCVGSAAHCTINRSPANTAVVVSAQNRITGGITHSATRIVNHPNYSSATLINDISVIQTSNETIENATVRPIALESKFVTGGQAVASGWRQKSHLGSAATELRSS